MGFLVRALSRGIFACLLWQWGTALGLALWSVFEPATFESASKLQRVAELPMYTLVALPLLILFVVMGMVVSMLRAEPELPRPDNVRTVATTPA
jgi:hypothetical protein